MMKLVADETERVKVQHVLRGEYTSLRQLFALYSAIGGSDGDALNVTWEGFERLCDDAGILGKDGCDVTVLQRIFIDTNVQAVPLEQHVLVRSAFFNALLMLALFLRRNMQKGEVADEKTQPELQSPSQALGMLLSQHIVPSAQARIRLDLRESLFVTENVSMLFEKNATDLREVFMAFSDRRVAEGTTQVGSDSTLISNSDSDLATGDVEYNTKRELENQGANAHEDDLKGDDARTTIAALSLPRFLDLTRSINACSRDDAVQAFSQSIKGHPADGKWSAQQGKRVMTFVMFMEALLRVALALAKRGVKLKAVRNDTDETQHAASYDIISSASGSLSFECISPELQKYAIKVSDAQQFIDRESNQEGLESLTGLERQSSVKSVSHSEVPTAISAGAVLEGGSGDHATVETGAVLPKSALDHDDGDGDIFYADEQGFAPTANGSESTNLNALSLCFAGVF